MQALTSFGLLCNGGGFLPSPAHEPSLSLARLANQVVQETALDVFYSTMMLMPASSCSSVAVQLRDLRDVPAWLVCVDSNNGGELWTALQAGDRVTGQLHCQEWESEGFLAGHTQPICPGQALPLPVAKRWKLCPAPTKPQSPVLIVYAATPRDAVTPDLALHLKALGFPYAGCIEPQIAVTRCQGESSSALINFASVVAADDTAARDEGGDCQAQCNQSRDGGCEGIIGEDWLDIGEGKWSSGIPLPEAEPVDSHVCDYLAREADASDIDGVRLMLLAAARDQETAMARELQAGESFLSEDTARCLAILNGSLTDLESELVEIADDTFEGYEDEGPQNRDLRLSAVTVEEQELLQTKMVPVADVGANIAEWRSALIDEATSLISEHEACRPITEDAVQKLEADPRFEVVRVPGKVVASIKPPNRKKARLVACGNYLVRTKNKGSPALDRKDVYCANMDTFSLRAQLAIGGLNAWTAASLDVRTAFLTAPFQAERGQSTRRKLIVVRAPRVMVLAGIFKPNTWLLVQGALYGLRESPHSWGISRDSKLSQLRWQGADGEMLELSQSAADVSLWCVRDCKSRSIKGTLGVYVDDLLLMTSQAELEPLIKALQSTWKCSAPAYATSPGGFTFCGVQIEQVGEDLWVHQAKYLGDLMQRYQHVKPSVLLPEFRQEPEEEVPTPEGVQKAQRIIGELTWIACRTRVDIAFAVNRLSRLAVACPTYAVACGEQILGFLFHTLEVKLRYGKCRTAPAAFQDELPVPRTSQLLEVWSDASFAQADSRSQSGVIVALGGSPIGWMSLRQPFISLSTCEAELVSCVEGVVLAQSLRPILEELSGTKLRWLLLTDNVAASTVILYPSGSWRTRHLRLRSRAVQELVDTEQLALYHIPGRVMVADLLTKTLPYAKLCELMSYLGYEGFKPPEPKFRTSAKTPPKLLLLCAAAPICAHAVQQEEEMATGHGPVWWKVVVVGMILVMIVGYMAYTGYRRWLTRVRLQRLREIANQVIAETEEQERLERERHRPAQQEPEPEANPESVEMLWRVLADHGTSILACLGPHGPETLALREVSGSIRMRVASAWALLFPRPPEPLHNEASEDTDSGLLPSSRSTPPSLSREWGAIHAQFVHDPNYDSMRAVDSFQIWLMSNRPYGPELEELPYVSRLTVPERAALHQAIDAYYEHSPTSVSTPTPEPSHLVDQEAIDEGFMRREVVERSRDRLEYRQRRQQAVEQAALSALRGEWAAEESPRETRAEERARGSQEPFVLRLQEDPPLGAEQAAAFDMDYQVAAAACLLYQYGYAFDWEQMTADQQDIYHGMIGRLLRTIEEVD